MGGVFKYDFSHPNFIKNKLRIMYSKKFNKSFNTDLATEVLIIYSSKRNSVWGSDQNKSLICI